MRPRKLACRLGREPRRAASGGGRSPGGVAAGVLVRRGGALGPHRARGRGAPAAARGARVDLRSQVSRPPLAPTGTSPTAGRHPTAPRTAPPPFPHDTLNARARRLVEGAAAAGFVDRLQSLSMWLIEHHSHLEPAVAACSALCLFESSVLAPPPPSPSKRARRPPGTPSKAVPPAVECERRLVGFATLCRDALNDTAAELTSNFSQQLTCELHEATPELNETAAGPNGTAARGAGERVALRVSQIAVLPPFQRRGHGAALLRAAYALAANDTRVAYVRLPAAPRAPPFLPLLLTGRASSLPPY